MLNQTKVYNYYNIKVNIKKKVNALLSFLVILVKINVKLNAFLFLASYKAVDILLIIDETKG